eukprot:CAMPEP_0178748866 /NCGR_PEP_ID=MMETSP0744-20121128/9104_1 /TAXON_ID=913974 /ORGANISM="Nitzschia punctata, Strain CCMP561" /LENGTH=99 /DNA_ID=CAMNT_0020402239 /DNA_START=63 /DNA_END=362 /DNA_ORIENTATION=+
MFRTQRDQTTTPDSATKMITTRTTTTHLPYLDRRINPNGTHDADDDDDNNNNIGSLELHSMRDDTHRMMLPSGGANNNDSPPAIRLSNSTGSDPVIAAI